MTVLGTALGNRIAWDRVLREVSLVLPNDVWLETMSTNGGSSGRGDPSAATRPDACTARRRILDHRLHVLP